MLIFSPRVTLIANFLEMEEVNPHNSEGSKTRADLERIVHLRSVSHTTANQEVALCSIPKRCSSTSLSTKLLHPSTWGKTTRQQMSRVDPSGPISNKSLITCHQNWMVSMERWMGVHWMQVARSGWCQARVVKMQIQAWRQHRGRSEACSGPMLGGWPSPEVVPNSSKMVEKNYELMVV